jgi:hypothetical protein
MNRLGANSLLFLLLAALGCGGTGNFHPVHGTVTFPDGTVLAGGSVEFRSEEPATLNWNATGQIDAQGKFTLRTFQDNRYFDGAVLGKHSIIVTPPPDEGSVAGSTPPAVLHSDMLVYEKSLLSFEVKPGANTCTLTVRKP